MTKATELSVFSSGFWQVWMFGAAVWCCFACKRRVGCGLCGRSHWLPDTFNRKNAEELKFQMFARPPASCFCFMSFNITHRLSSHMRAKFNPKHPTEWAPMTEMGGVVSTFKLEPFRSHSPSRILFARPTRRDQFEIKCWSQAELYNPHQCCFTSSETWSYSSDQGGIQKLQTSANMLQFIPIIQLHLNVLFPS